MNYYVEKLHEYLETHKPNYGDSDINSLMEMLYGAYTLCNPIDSEEIRQQFNDLDESLSGLPFAEQAAVFLRTCEICTAHELKAFLEGINVGLRLFVELSRGQMDS